MTQKLGVKDKIKALKALYFSTLRKKSEKKVISLLCKANVVELLELFHLGTFNEYLILKTTL